MPRDVTNAALLVLADAEDDRLRVVVLAHDPHDESTQVLIVDELAQRLATTPHDEVLAALLRQVALVDEAGDDVAALDVEVVVLAVHVARDHRRELAAVLLGVAPVEDIDHALGVRVSLVRRVRRPVVKLLARPTLRCQSCAGGGCGVRVLAAHHGLINGVRGLVRKDARGQARHQLLHLELTAALHDVVVHQRVVAVELHVVREVVEQAPNEGGQVNDVGRPHTLKDGTCGGGIADIGWPRRTEYIGLGSASGSERIQATTRLAQHNATGANIHK